MRLCSLILLWASAAIAAGEEIRLDAPASPVQPREYVQILVQGLPDAEMPAASIEWTPRDDTTLIPARLWGGQPFLLFAGRRPGTYTIVVTTHGWRTNLDAAVDAARRAALIDQDLFQRLESLAADMRSRYPVRTGTCTVIVAGAPEPPEPRPPPVTAADQVTIITESQEPASAEQLEIVNGEAVRQAAAAAGLEFQHVDQHATGPDIEHVRHALEDAVRQGVPRIVFSASGTVTESLPLPASVADTVELIRMRRRQ